MSTDLNVKVDANTSGFEASIARAEKATRQYDSALGRLAGDLARLEKEMDDQVKGAQKRQEAALQRQHDAMDKTGRAAFVFGAAVAAGVGVAVHAAMQWESAWAGVTKTVNGSARQMDFLEGQLRGLAKTLPSSHEEIAAVAEAAGQLGVRREDIAGFTKVMIDLGQTTNLSADDAATSIAQMMNVMGTAGDKVDEIGSTLVALGNAGASTEADIMHMAQRLTGAGKLIGASESDVLALASAMSNLGIQAELGGGAMQRVLLRIYQDVKMADKGGADLLGKTAGMSGSQFAQLFNTAPARALDALFKGLGRIKDSGGDVIQALDDLGIKGTQNLQVMLRLAGAGDMLTESLDQSSAAWDKNNALLVEANKRYETTASKVKVAKNQLEDAAITVGGTLLPAFAAVADTVGDFAAAFELLPGPAKSAVGILGGLVAAVALVGGASLIAVPKIAAFKTAVAGLESGALKTAGNKLMGLGTFLTGPWGIAITAGVTALGIFAAKQGEAAREVDALKATLDEQTGALTQNSREWAIKKLSDEGALQKAKDLGLNLSTVTDAALGNKDAIAALNGEFERYKALGAPTDDSGVWTGQGKAARDLQNILLGTNGTVVKSRQEWQLQAEAMGGATGAANDAASAAQYVGATAQEAAGGITAIGDAAASTGEEVNTLGEDLRDLSAPFLDARAAARGVREGLRGIDEAIAAYRKEHKGLDGAFKDGTKSGDEFGAMLDGLAGDYQTKLDATENAGASEKRVQAVYDRSRAKLIEVATQLLGNQDAAKKYADAVLDVPGMVETHFETPGLPAAVDDVASLRIQIGGLRDRTITIKTVHRDTRVGGAGIAANPTLNANGGLYVNGSRQFADGGFTADGRYVPRQPMIATGQDIRWAEPETGWEAYISGKPGQEARNRDVWLEAGRRLGMARDGQALQQMFTNQASYARGGFGGLRQSAATVSAGSSSVTLDPQSVEQVAAALLSARSLYGDVIVKDGTEFRRHLAADQVAHAGGGRATRR